MSESDAIERQLRALAAVEEKAAGKSIWKTLEEKRAAEAAAIDALKDHPLVAAVASMNRAQRKAFESTLRRLNRKDPTKTVGLDECFAAARSRGWRGAAPSVRIVPKDSDEAILRKIAGDPDATTFGLPK